MTRLRNLAPFLILLTACGLGAGSDEPEAGQETGPCLEGSCFDGLNCLSDLCVDPDAASDGSGDGASSNSGGSSPNSTSGPSSASGDTADSTDSGAAETASNPSEPTGASTDETSGPSTASEEDTGDETNGSASGSEETTGETGVCVVPTCDSCGDCESCVDCMGSPGGDCQSEVEACEADADCLAIFNCALACPTPDLVCARMCSVGHEPGVDAFTVALECVIGNLLVPDGPCAADCVTQTSPWGRPARPSPRRGETPVGSPQPSRGHRPARISF